MKTLIKLFLFCSSFTLAASAFAAGRNSTVPENPALPPSNPALPAPANPAVPPVLKPRAPAKPVQQENPARPVQNPARPQANPAVPPAHSLDPARPPLQAQPIKPKEPSPVLVETPEEENPALAQQENEYTIQMVAPQPPVRTCEVTTKQALIGAWRGFVDWDCDNRNLHPVNWAFYARPRGGCCDRPQDMNGWKVTFDGPYVMMTDNRVNGAVFQGAYNDFNVIQGNAYYMRAIGCFQITRVTPPPMCDGSRNPDMVTMPPPPPEYLPVLVR